MSFALLATLTAEQLDFLHPLPKVTQLGPPGPLRSDSAEPGTSESTVHEPPEPRNDGMTGSEPLCPEPGLPSDEPA